jgi:putative sigma-54 modulation protein
MDIPIDFLIRAGRHDTVDALREYAGHRLSFTLRRFAHRIRRVNLRLVDVNGPRGGVDSRCSIVAELTDRGHLFVDAIAAWPFAAITTAARRLNEAMRREGDRLVEDRATSARAFRQHDGGRQRAS